MRAKIQLKNADSLEAVLTVSMPIGDWKVIAAKLKTGIDLSYHGTAEAFLSAVNQVIEKATQVIETEEEL